jgi:hypothetical protein
VPARKRSRRRYLGAGRRIAQQPPVTQCASARQRV